MRLRTVLLPNQALGRYYTNRFEENEADRAWQHKRSIQVDLLWDPSATAASKQARPETLHRILIGVD